MPLSVESAGIAETSLNRGPVLHAPLSEQKSCPDSIVVVIPAYNEELVIGSVVLRARRCAETVIVVDDGSKDGTAEIARLAGADVVVMPENSGKAAALIIGSRFMESVADVANTA